MSKKTTTKAKAPKTTKPAKANSAPAVEAQAEPQVAETKKAKKAPKVTIGATFKKVTNKEVPAPKLAKV